MKIKCHAQLLWNDKVYWLVSEKPRFVENRLTHDRYDVVPAKDDVTSVHSYIRYIDVPKNGYAVVGTSEYIIKVQE